MEPPEIVPRVVTVTQQIDVPRAALGHEGKVVLQAILAAAATRTERLSP